MRTMLTILLLPCMAFAADIVEAFGRISRNEASRYGGRPPDGSCILTTKWLGSGSGIVQVAVPHRLSHRFKKLSETDGGIFALYNTLKFARIACGRSDQFSAHRAIQDFYKSYDSDFNDFGEPLQTAFGDADFDAHKLFGMLDNLPGSNTEYITFVDQPDIQPFLMNPFATPDGNVLGRYHAQLRSAQDFFHGIVFHYPPADARSSNGVASIFACRERGVRYYFVTDSSNQIFNHSLPKNDSRYRAPLLEEVPDGHNPVLAFIETHLDRPVPINCLPQEPDPLADDLARVVLGAESAGGDSWDSMQE